MVFILVRKEENFRDKYVQLERHGGLYFEKNYSRDRLIDFLVTLFNETGPDARCLLMELLDPKSEGLSGDLTDVTIEGDKVLLEPSRIMRTDTSDDDPIEISRTELIRLAQEWEALVKKNVPEIFIVYKDGRYFVAETLPEGVT